MNLSGLIDNNQYFGQVTGQAHLTKCFAPESRLDQMQTASIQFDINYKDDSLAIQQADLDVDGNARIGLKGNIDLNKNLMAELFVQAQNVDVAGLTQYLPSN